MAINLQESNSFYINKPDNKIVENTTNNILKKSNAIKFHSSLFKYQPTPLINLPNLAKKYKVGNIYIKDESYRFGLNAFKGLGALFAISKILKSKPDITTFCAATDGNHGRAVAWSAKYFNKKAIIFTPKDTTQRRIQAIKKEGADIKQINGNYDETCAYARKMSCKNGWELVQDTAWKNYEQVPAQIMAGYLTLFQEMEDSIHPLPEAKIDIVFLQAGVGSFAGTGIAYYLNRYGSRRPKIVIVEPKEADAILCSFKKGKISTSLGNSQTIMAGLNCGTPSFGVWDLFKSGTDVSIKIDDKYSKKAMKELYFSKGTDKQIVSGESGVAGLAGFIAIKREAKFKIIREILKINTNTNILFISTEGATDSVLFNKIIES